MRQINRIAPLMRPGAYKTYTVAAPLASHWRKATCEEVQCQAHTAGWQTIIDERTPGVTGLALRQAHYIRNDSGRSYTESVDAGFTVFDFAPGQNCFQAHKIKTGRPEIYLVKPGDHRTNGTPFTHTRPDDWVEDFAQHQQTISDEIAKG